MSFSDYLETEALEWAFTASGGTRPTSWHLALFTAAPNDAGGGTEVSGTAYARESFTFTVAGDTATNAGAIEFATAGSAWGTVTHIGVFDASTAGNLLAWAALDASKAIGSGDVLRVPAGDLDITLA